MTETTKRDEREAFEAWAKERGHDTLRAPEWKNVDYHSLSCEDAWLGWKACAALATAPEQAGEPVWPVPLTMDHGHVVEHAIELRFEDEEDADRFFAMYSAAMGNTAPPPASTNRLTDEQCGAIQYAIAMVKSGPGWNIWHVDTLDALLRASRRCGDGRRVVKEENPACGLSWNGFNISGDEKSIREVRHLVNVAGYVSSLQEQLKQARAIIAATEGK